MGICSTHQAPIGSDRCGARASVQHNGLGFGESNRYPSEIIRVGVLQFFIAARFVNLAVSLPQYQFASHRLRVYVLKVEFSRPRRDLSR